MHRKGHRVWRREHGAWGRIQILEFGSWNEEVGNALHRAELSLRLNRAPCAVCRAPFSNFRLPNSDFKIRVTLYLVDNLLAVILYCPYI